MKEFKIKNRNVYINDSTLKLIESFKQTKKRDNESGGILLGQIKDNDIYILKASIPNEFDKASRNSFECNKDAAQVIMDYEFFNSDKKTIYLGEWHTHPEKFPNPSFVDKKMIKNQFFKNKLNEAFLILLIQGLDELYIAMYDGKTLKKDSYVLFNNLIKK